MDSRLLANNKKWERSDYYHNKVTKYKYPENTTNYELLFLKNDSQ